MIAILDTNAVIGLAKGECLEHINAVFQQVIIPPAVRHEVVEEGRGRAGARELQAALGKWIREQAPAGRVARPAMSALSIEDEEVLALALEQGGVLVTDDVVLRREADSLGIRIMGTVQLVMLLKQQGLLTAARPVLNLMQVRGYHIDPALYTEALRVLGEEEPPSPS